MFISSGFSALLSTVLKPLALGTFHLRSTKFDALTICNGALIGMVSISGVVDQVQNWGAVLIGSVSAFVYVATLVFLEFYRIDDPLECIPVHFSGGVWGLFATGLFSSFSGALYSGALKQGIFMGYQLVGIVVIVVFTSLVILPTFLILSKTGALRADKAIEEIGFDVAELIPGVSKEFLDAVRENIETKEKHSHLVLKKLDTLGNQEA